MEPTTIGAASEEEEIRLEDLVRSGRAAVDEGADDFNLAVAVLKGASEQGKLFKDRGGTEAVEGVLRTMNERLAELLAEAGCSRVQLAKAKRGSEHLRRFEALLRSLAATAVGVGGSGSGGGDGDGSSSSSGDVLRAVRNYITQRLEYQQKQQQSSSSLGADAGSMNVDAPAFPFSAISLKWPNGCFTVLADLKEDAAKRRLALQLCHLLLLVLEEEIRQGDLVRSGHAAVDDEGADDFNLAVAVLKGASEQGKLFKARASEQGKKSASASASASSSFRHRLLFSADARVATSTTPEDGKGVKDSDAEHDDENSASFQDQDEDEADSDSNASRGRSDDDDDDDDDKEEDEDGSGRGLERVIRVGLRVQRLFEPTAAAAASAAEAAPAGGESAAVGEEMVAGTLVAIRSADSSAPDNTDDEAAPSNDDKESAETNEVGDSSSFSSSSSSSFSFSCSTSYSIS